MPTSKYHRVYKFSNGATLIYFKHNVNNTTEILAGYISGAQKDKIPGTAHFLEHMMSSLGEYQNLASKYDIVTNAHTTHSYVAFELDIPNQHLDDGIKLLDKMIFNTHFDSKEFENERNAILQESLLYVNKQLTIEDLYYKTFSAQGILGTEEQIKSITIKDIEEYQNENFVADNLIVCVASSLDFETIKDKIEKDIISKAKSDLNKKNYPYKDIKLNPKSYFIYEPYPNIKTVNICFALVDDMSLETSLVYGNVDDFVFNDSFSGLLLKKLRTERGIVYSANMTTICGTNHDAYKIFQITTSREHVNEAIDALGEVLKIARQGLTKEQYNDYITKLKTIESDRRALQKYLEPTIIFQRYITGQKLWFNNPVHKAVDLTYEQINNYLGRTYKNKPVFFNVIGDIDMDTIYSPIEIQQITNTKPLKYIMERDKNGTVYYSSETGEKVDEKEVKSQHTGYISVAGMPEKSISLTEFILALSEATDGEKIATIENLANAIGIKDFEKVVKEHGEKRRRIEAFAKKLNIDLDLVKNEAHEIKQDDEVDEKTKALRDLPFSKRLELIEKYAEKLDYYLEFNYNEHQNENKNKDDMGMER